MIDLHTHSLYSDGTMSPLELVDYAAEHGVKTLALTDHDTVAGVSECRAVAIKKGMNFISGIELSVNWSNKVIHVVGLGVDIENKENRNIQRKAFVGIALAFFIYGFIFLYSVQVMRGVIEEKTNRIVEVIISSVSTFELMMASA